VAFSTLPAKTTNIKQLAHHTLRSLCRQLSNSLCSSRPSRPSWPLPSRPLRRPAPLRRTTTSLCRSGVYWRPESATSSLSKKGWICSISSNKEADDLSLIAAARASVIAAAAGDAAKPQAIRMARTSTSGALLVRILRSSAHLCVHEDT
jgi:hypothetical protein